MAEGKKSFLLYCDQRGIFDQLPDELAGKLIKHIFAYVNDEDPKTEELWMTMAFESIKTALKRDLEKYKQKQEQGSINGKKGGRPKKGNETQKTQPFLEEGKKGVNVNVSVSDSVSVNENEKKKRTKFVPPKIEECIAYAQELGYKKTFAENFHNDQTSKGWKAGRVKIEDWQAAMRYWTGKEWNEKYRIQQPTNSSRYQTYNPDIHK